MRTISLGGRERIILGGDPDKARWPLGQVTVLSLADDSHDEHEIQIWEPGREGGWYPDPERHVYLSEAEMTALLEAVALPRILKTIGEPDPRTYGLVCAGGFWVFFERLSADVRSWLGLSE